MRMETISKTGISFFLLLLSLVLTSCSDKGESVISPIQGSTWRLQSIQSWAQTIEIPSDEVYTLHFSTDTLVTGQVHCNTYFTGYHVVPPDSISFGPFNTTKIQCSQPSNQEEFRLAFENSNSFEAAGTQLLLYYMNRTRLLKFEKAI